MDWKNKEDVREYMREYRRTHNSNKSITNPIKKRFLRKTKNIKRIIKK